MITKPLILMQCCHNKIVTYLHKRLHSIASMDHSTHTPLPTIRTSYNDKQQQARRKSKSTPARAPAPALAWDFRQCFKGWDCYTIGSHFSFVLSNGENIVLSFKKRGWMHHQRRLDGEKSCFMLWGGTRCIMPPLLLPGFPTLVQECMSTTKLGCILVTLWFPREKS